MPARENIPPPEKIFDRMLEVESNKRQFDSKGNPLTSSAGAIGIAQVMPGTAPEAAKLAGLPFDPQRYRFDAEYNKALGQAYFQEMLRIFEDPVLAVAAYNAGPANVRRALQSAEEGGSFVENLPLETQGYIKKVFGEGNMRAGGRVARATGGKIGSPVQSLVSKLINAAENAKHHNSSKTQDFLDVHDDHIAKALEVADKSI